MNDSIGNRRNNCPATAALILAAGWVLAWLGGLLVDTGSWAVRAVMLAAGLALAGGAALLWLRRAERERETVERYFESLCRMDSCSLDQKVDSEPPSLPPNVPFAKTATRLREVLLECCRRTQELKQTRTAWEIRCRRAMTECDQIKRILSGLAEPILAIDDYDELVLANRSAEELFQFDAANTSTKSIARLVHCEKLVDLLTTTAHRNTQGNRTDEIEIGGPEGQSRWYRATALKLTESAPGKNPPDRDSDTPALRGAVAVLRDIGDQKSLQKRNAEFVSAVSHEMKTPLAGIKAYVELLADGDAEDEETREEFLSIINGQADRLQRLIDNMLNLARIEAGVVNVSKHTRSLNELLEEALRVVQPAADARRIELVSELSPMYLGVLADRDMLLQAAINLLSNAVKYTPEAGRVILRSRLEDNLIRFEVQDTGVGLSAEDCQRIFEKFYRVNKSKDMASGTGLGLPLAKHIVEDVHGGRLTAESVLGKGSTFSVTIPNAGQMG